MEEGLKSVTEENKLTKKIDENCLGFFYWVVDILGMNSVVNVQRKQSQS
jgi:hypothetical protein